MRDAKPQCCGCANSQPSHGASVRQPGSANAAAVRAGHVGLGGAFAGRRIRAAALACALARGVQSCARSVMRTRGCRGRVGRRRRTTSSGSTSWLADRLRARGARCVRCPRSLGRYSSAPRSSRTQGAQLRRFVRPVGPRRITAPQRSRGRATRRGGRHMGRHLRSGRKRSQWRVVRGYAWCMRPYGSVGPWFDNTGRTCGGVEGLRYVGFFTFFRDKAPF